MGVCSGVGCAGRVGAWRPGGGAADYRWVATVEGSRTERYLVSVIHARRVPGKAGGL